MENKSILHEKRKLLHQQTLALNEVKKEIDRLKEFLDTSKVQERDNEDSVLEQEEFDGIYKLTELKSSYKQLLNEIQNLRPQIEHCQVLVEQARSKMMTEFEIWYQQIFPVGNNQMGK